MSDQELLDELAKRLELARREAFDAGSANDAWAMEVDRLTRELARSVNYVADRECMPFSVTFRNGRRVRIVWDECGNASLDVDYDRASVDTEAEKALSLIPSDFIDRLVAGQIPHR